MSNHKLIFYGTELSETQDHELECYINANMEIWISINTNLYPNSFICLDKSTAIKLAKTLRTEINKIQE